MTILGHSVLNNTSTALATATVAANATSFAVTPAVSVAPPFKATFATTGEIIEVGAVSGATWSSITRGAEGTTAAAYTAGTRLELRLTAGMVTERSGYNVYPSLTAATNTLNIRAAIANDGYVSLAPGTYPIALTGSETALFEMTTAMEIDGNGATLRLAADTPTTVDVFHVLSLNANDGGIRGHYIHDLKIIPEAAGAGRHAIHYNSPDTTGGWFWNTRIERVTVGKEGFGTGPQLGMTGGIKLTNPTHNDCFFVCAIKDVTLINGGGFDMQRLGDSVIFDGCQVWSQFGTATAYTLSFVNYAGVVVLQNCNSWWAGTVIDATLASTNGIKVINCNFESHPTVTTSAGACVKISGGTNNEIRGGRIAHLGGGTSSMHGLHALNWIGGTIVQVECATVSAGKNALLVQGGTTNYAPQASNHLSAGTYSNTGTSRAAI